MRWAGHVVRVGKYKCIISLEDNIKTDLKEILWESVERMFQEYLPAFARSE